MFHQGADEGGVPPPAGGIPGADVDVGVAEGGTELGDQRVFVVGADEVWGLLPKLKADLAVTLQVGVVTIGTYRTDSTGTVRRGFAAPNHEVEAAAVVVLAGGTSARATLTVAK